MEKLKLTIAYVKSHPLIVGISLVVIIGYLISLIPNPGNQSFTPTQPIIPSLTPVSLNNKNYSQVFSGEADIKVSNNQSIFSINKNHRLVQHFGNTAQPITPSGLTIADYTVKGDTIIFEAGAENDPDNVFYYLKPSNRSYSKIDINFLKPVTAYGINPQENTLALLGKSSAEKSETSLYLYNFSTQIASLAAQKIDATDLSWLDNNHLLIINETKQPIVNSYIIGIFSLSENKIIIKNISSLKNTILFDEKRSTVYFTNTKNSTFASLNITDYSFSTILNLAILPRDIILGPKSGNLALIIDQNNQTIVRSVSPNEKRILHEYVLPLNPQQVYIEHFLTGESNYIKIYDRETKEYSIQSIVF